MSRVYVVPWQALDAYATRFVGVARGPVSLRTVGTNLNNTNDAGDRLWDSQVLYTGYTLS